MRTSLRLAGMVGPGSRLRSGASLSSALPAGCVWCGRPFGPAGRDEQGWRVCTSCGVGTTWPWPTEAELDEAYGLTYRPSSGRFIALGDRLLALTRAAPARRVDRRAPAGPVLDVGAGDGTLVRSLRSRGRVAIGIERNSGPSEQRVTPTADGPAVVTADLEAVSGSWAAVVFWHSLEHLARPSAALDQAVRLLMPGGLLVVAVPNAASLQARWFGPRWFARDWPRHLAHIPAPALLAHLSERGLRIDRVSHVRGGQVVFGWLASMVAGLPGRLDLYQAVRSEGAQEQPLTSRRRLASLLAGAVLWPMAAVMTVVETVLRRGGTVYIEARR